MSLSGLLGVATFFGGVVGGIVYFDIQPQSTAKIWLLGGSSFTAGLGVHYYADKAFKILFPDWLYLATQKYLVKFVDSLPLQYPMMDYGKAASEKRRQDDLTFTRAQNANWNNHAEYMNLVYGTHYCKRY